MFEEVTLAQHIASRISELGVRHVFGIIGAGNIAIWNAIHERGETELVACHHEQAASMAAAYYARATGGLGIVLVTTGAGSSNAITGVMAAHMDYVPLLVISGNEARKYIGANERIWGVQGYDSATVAEGFTKYSDRIMSAGSAFILEDAISKAKEAPQGAVWVDIPKDVQHERV